MQGQSTQNTIFSFVVLPTPVQYITFLPITPSTPDYISPTSQPTFASLSFTSRHIHELYCAQDPSAFPPNSATSIAEPRQASNPPLNSGNIQLSNIQNPPAINHPPRTPAYNPESSLLLEDAPASSVEVSRRNKKQKIKQLRTRIKEVQQEDKQYVPQSERKKKDSAKYHQNDNRNIIPNEINQIFSFIQKYNKSGYLLERLFTRFPHPPTFTIRRFYLYQGILKSKLGHYANERSLKLVTELYEPKCESWPEQEQRYYNKLCRILIRHFLYEDSIFIILTSKRMRREKKLDHLRARRFVARSVLQILKGF